MGTTARSAGTFRPGTGASGSTGSTPRAAGTPAASTTTHPLRQVPPRVLRQGRHAPLPQAQEPLALPGDQPGQDLEPRRGGGAPEGGGRQGQGGGDRRHRVLDLQGAGQGAAARAAPAGEGPLRLQPRREEDQGRRGGRGARRLGEVHHHRRGYRGGIRDGEKNRPRTTY